MLRHNVLDLASSGQHGLRGELIYAAYLTARKCNTRFKRAVGTLSIVKPVQLGPSNVEILSQSVPMRPLRGRFKPRWRAQTRRNFFDQGPYDEKNGVGLFFWIDQNWNRHCLTFACDRFLSGIVDVDRGRRGFLVSATTDTHFNSSTTAGQLVSSF